MLKDVLDFVKKETETNHLLLRLYSATYLRHSLTAANVVSRPQDHG